jgi:hypothetical protein
LSKISQDAFTGAQEIDFSEEKEFWNEYKLADGTTLKVKLVLRGVKRLNQFEPDGTPIYAINSMNVVRAVDVPTELKAKPKKSEMNPV